MNAEQTNTQAETLKIYLEEIRQMCRGMRELNE